MVPVNEVTTEGQPVLLVKNLPPVSSAGAPTVTEPRIYFGEAPSGYVIVRARAGRVRLPARRGRRRRRQGVRTRWSGTTRASSSTRRCPGSSSPSGSATSTC